MSLRRLSLWLSACLCGRKVVYKTLSKMCSYMNYLKQYDIHAYS